MAITINTIGGSFIVLKCARTDLVATLGDGNVINQATALVAYDFQVTDAFKTALEKFNGRLLPIGAAYYKNFENTGVKYYPVMVDAFPNTSWSSEMNKMQILTKRVTQANNQIKNCDGFIFYFLNLNN